MEYEGSHQYGATMDCSKTPLLDSGCRQLHVDWTSAIREAPEYAVAWALAAQKDRWAELQQTTEATWKTESVRTLKYNDWKGVSSLMVLLAGIFTEHTAFRSNSTPVDPENRAGSSF